MQYTIHGSHAIPRLRIFLLLARFCITEKELFTCRDVLWYLVFCGFAVNYVLRINLNLTIVAMVLPYPKPAAIVQCNIENSTVSWTNETAQDSNVSLSFPITTSSPENITVFTWISLWRHYSFICGISYSLIFYSMKIDSLGTSINRDWHWVLITGCTGYRNCPVVFWPGGTVRNLYSD